MDRVTKRQRSRIMSRIKSRNTGPEKIMWKLLKELKSPPQRWAAMTGKPDFVFQGESLVVFVDGCFFHRCPRHLSNPKTNRMFWQKKFAANIARDRKVNQILTSEGWRVMRFWECDLKQDPDDILYKIEELLQERIDEISQSERQNNV